MEFFLDAILRPNSWTQFRQKSKEFSSLLFTVICSFALRFLFLQTHATSYSFLNWLLYTVNEKGGKTYRKPYPRYGLSNPYRNLKSENSLKIMPRNLNEIVRLWIRLLNSPPLSLSWLSLLSTAPRPQYITVVDWCCYLTVDFATAASQNRFSTCKRSIHTKTNIIRLKMTKTWSLFFCFHLLYDTFVEL